MSTHPEPKPQIEVIRRRQKDLPGGYWKQANFDCDYLLSELDQARSENELLAAKVAVVIEEATPKRTYVGAAPTVVEQTCRICFDKAHQNEPLVHTPECPLRDLPTAAASLLERVKMAEADRDALIDAAGNPERYALRMIAERDAAIARAEKAEAALSAKQRAVTREDVAAVLDADILCFPPKRNLSAANWERQRAATFAKADAVLALFQPDQMGTKD